VCALPSLRFTPAGCFRCSGSCRTGVSDYLASPLLFTDGDIHLATWTTRQPGGFTDVQIEGIECIIAPFRARC